MFLYAEITLIMLAIGIGVTTATQSTGSGIPAASFGKVLLMFACGFGALALSWIETSL